MLNPITYTEQIVRDFLRYQLTTYPFADRGLLDQMRKLLNLEVTRATPLLKGPYIKLSGAFKMGGTIDALARAGVLHPQLRHLARHKQVYAHQEAAIRAIAAGRTTLVATGTGSGKTEAFLYPIISRCLQLRDEQAPPGIVAVLVYPMNALAEDQLDRLRGLLVGTNIPFAMYIGKTRERKDEIVGERLRVGASRLDYEEALHRSRERKLDRPVHPHEERVTREELRAVGGQPRILLTNVKQLELLLTRANDAELFHNARLDYLVFDEAHTFTGAQGAETACLVRRLRSFCGRGPDETVCIATSATIADPARGAEAGREFAARFFGVAGEQVALVGEVYEPDTWAPARRATPAPADPRGTLAALLETLEKADEEPPAPNALATLQGLVHRLGLPDLDVVRWRASLKDLLAANEVVYQLADALTAPRALQDLVQDLGKRLGRPMSEEEVLAWLALGASARSPEGPALLRPVVHAFIRGVSGAVVSFPPTGESPRLWLAAEDAESSGHFRLPVRTCTTCGQHYFTHHVRDFRFTAKAPGGGEANESHVVWRSLEESKGGCRLVLVDRLLGDDEIDDDNDPNDLPPRTAAVYFCRICGALHDTARPQCTCSSELPLVRLLAVQSSEEHPGRLKTCLSCKATGRVMFGQFREPAREVRAVTVSDVHVLAQSMIQHAERRRLLVFADNRQDAAFQAGWMRDHARRYRLRGLMYDRIRRGKVSVGDLVGHLDDELDRDDDLSEALVPEVWRVARKDALGEQHPSLRRRFLRVQVLRELAVGNRQRIGLEPWGRARVRYHGLRPELPFMTAWSAQLGCTPEALCDGVSSLLDATRRGRVLFDRDTHLYSNYWHDSDREVSQGIIPMVQGGPRGLKLTRTVDDHKSFVQQWFGARGDSVARQAARRWGVKPIDMPAFFQELWTLLTDELRLLVHVNLLGGRQRVLPGTRDVRQINADMLEIEPNTGLYRCDTCRRTHVRATPNLACMAWHCRGSLRPEQEDPDNYDLRLLDDGFAMLRPREHSAQVPPAAREEIEIIFKSDTGERINTLVCTATLELGVDIGGLDAVLMRNVPPLPANYWQRAGRAGRRDRMAVNLAYARPLNHDRAYFNDPLKMLGGRIDPPSFNLRNEVMVRKHVHATILTALRHLSRSGDISQEAREELAQALTHSLPRQIKGYLFDDAGEIRPDPFDLGPLYQAISIHEPFLHQYVAAVFAQGWPAADAIVVRPDILAGYVRDMPKQFEAVLLRLRRRLQWSLTQMRRLDLVRESKGALDPDEEALRDRCNRQIKRLKGIQRRRRREAEGHDDTYTFTVLAAEGFLPGYGLDTGAVVGFHLRPNYNSDLQDWELHRATALALREYVPGNLIYAHGHRFIPRFYQLAPTEQTVRFIVSTPEEAVSEEDPAADGYGMHAVYLPGIPICDVDLPHFSHISDDEEHRFQLGVAVYGYEQPRHGAGRVFQWGERQMSLRRAVSLRLVNVGASMRIAKRVLGYPVCRVCGQSRSALASDVELTNFRKNHLERCGQAVEDVGFYADIIADALTLQDLADRAEAYSVMEALRKGAAQVLDMELEDLQILRLPRAGEEVANIMLYDPMPGGSGLLEQLVARFPEVIAAALEVVERCPASCASSCIDCLQHFRNAHYHTHLSRHIAADRLRRWGDTLRLSHEIEARQQGATSSGQPTNLAERELAAMLRRAGFHEFIAQHPIDLAKPLGVTTPDFFFADSDEPSGGVCIYLDGLSEHIHGNETTRRRDMAIRQQLRNRPFMVVLEIAYTDLRDRNAMQRHFFDLGKALSLDKSKLRELREDPRWFVHEGEPT